MIELFQFQQEAAEVLSNRMISYQMDPLLVSKEKSIPLYTVLQSITGSGKTIILAEMLEQFRAQSDHQPIILWVSKGKVVVGQTLENFSDGGKYSQNIPNYKVIPLLDCTESDIISNESLLLIATVGKFNQKDKDQGDRRIFQTNLDKADSSLWDLLKQRSAGENKRELIIVYDEGHNLSDQQVELLLELNPLAIVAASATTKVPNALEYIVTRLEYDKALKKEDLVTVINNKDVVESGLIKKNISISGYLTPMEDAIKSLLDDFKESEDVSVKIGTPFLPKAIYVSDTNMIMNRSMVDDVNLPFDQRQARPIQIWKQLVKSGIDPEEIAVYCNLKFDSSYPAPNNFHLFSGGDNDYELFSQGQYRHIIFNQTLQEGWDDPSCCFAYIDKDMGSTTQVTQIIGRVLRQPNAQHFPDELLNTANFYIKTDERELFREIIDDIQKTLVAEMPAVNFSYHLSKSNTSRKIAIYPKNVMDLPAISIDSSDAKKEIDTIINQMNDYRNDAVNTIGEGEKITVKASIGSDSNLDSHTVASSHSNKVTARWIFKRQIDKHAKKAITLCDLADPKFDALIEYNSNAANYVRNLADQIVGIYRNRSKIVQVPWDTQPVGSVFDGKDSKDFTNGLHHKYSGFNDFELRFATELDALGLMWMRNPANGFLKIPLLDGKGTENFNPDFIVWDTKTIFALDTKGKHLVMDESRRKLFFIENLGDEGVNISVKFITEGKYDDRGHLIDPKGYSVWKLKQGIVRVENCTLLSDAARICVEQN